MRHRKAAAVLTLAMLLPSPGHADGLASQAASFPWRARNIRFSKHLVAHPGQTIRVNTFYSLAADCSPTGWPQMQVRFPPLAGQVEERHGTGYPGYPRRNVRHLCNGSPHPGDVITYRAPDGFTGTDHFIIDMVFPNDRAAYQSISVDVR